MTHLRSINLNSDIEHKTPSPNDDAELKAPLLRGVVVLIAETPSEAAENELVRIIAAMKLLQKLVNKKNRISKGITVVSFLFLIGNTGYCLSLLDQYNATRNKFLSTPLEGSLTSTCPDIKIGTLSMPTPGFWGDITDCSSRNPFKNEAYWTAKYVVCEAAYYSLCSVINDMTLTMGGGGLVALNVGILVLNGLLWYAMKDCITPSLRDYLARITPDEKEYIENVKGEHGLVHTDNWEEMISSLQESKKFLEQKLTQEERRRKCRVAFLSAYSTKVERADTVTLPKTCFQTLFCRKPTTKIRHLTRFFKKLGETKNTPGKAISTKIFEFAGLSEKEIKQRENMEARQSFFAARLSVANPLDMRRQSALGKFLLSFDNQDSKEENLKNISEQIFTFAGINHKKS